MGQAVAEGDRVLAAGGERGQEAGDALVLVEQAALQVTLMTGREAPVDAMREAGVAALGVSG